MIETMDLVKIDETELKNKMMPIGEYVKNIGLLKKTPESYKEVSNFVFTLKDFYKVIDNYWDTDKERAYQLYKSLTAKKKVFTDKLSEYETISKDWLIDYQETERRKIAIEQAENLKKQREAEEKAQVKAEKELARGNIEKAQAIMSNVPTVPVVVSEPTKVEGISSRTVWSCEIVDETKIPRKFLIPDLTALNKLAQACKGNVTVPGVKFISRQVMAAGRRV